MIRCGWRPALIAVLIALTGCVDDEVTSPVTTPVVSNPPTVAAANVVVGTTVGLPFTFDAAHGGTVFSDPAGRGLTYGVTFPGGANGLTATGSIITGTPLNSAVIAARITATDALGRSISDDFGIVALSSDLATPRLPAIALQYTGTVLPGSYNAPLPGGPAFATDNTPSSNPVTTAGATLGRVLFYDPRLSVSDGTSCASCHLQSVGFSDRSALSVGFAGGLTARHTPGLTNARFYQRGRFFWDERAATLEEQVLGPIQNATEMGMTLSALVMKISVTPYYAPLFTAAFGNATVTSDRIARALAQFVRSMVSTQSRFDKAFATGPPNFAGVFTAEEVLGEQLFRTKGCAACHTTGAQVADGIHNTGLDATITDAGAGGGAFKVPSLRNVAVRARFMHDGRFSTLAQVVDFYDAGVQPNPGLDPRMRTPNGPPLRLNMTPAEKQALVAFMRTLTDSTFLADARFSNPYVNQVNQDTALTLPPVPPIGAPLTGAVTIQFNSFRPSSLTVGRGAVISYTNLDNSAHGAIFDSPSITPTPRFNNGTRTVTMPTIPGVYAYHCIVHGFAMTGTITVQ